MTFEQLTDGGVMKPVKLLTDQQLHAALRFLDCDQLRDWYTGYIRELRAELACRDRLEGGVS